MAECWDEHNVPREVQSIAIRVNLKAGGVGADTFASLPWYFSSDESADLALTPLSLKSTVDYLSIPTDRFFTKDLFATDNVGEGAKIILSGYFYQLEGLARVEPLIREGILSMIPDVPLQTTTGKQGPLYLGDVHILVGTAARRSLSIQRGYVRARRFNC